jgi:hypothetical protein
LFDGANVLLLHATKAIKPSIEYTAALCPGSRRGFFFAGMTGSGQTAV